MGLAYGMYAEDHDGRFPWAWIESEQEPPGGGWYKEGKKWSWFVAQILYPYHKNHSIHLCPSGLSEFNRTPFLGHYGVNGDIIYSDYDKKPSRTLAEIQAPASTYLYFDSGSYQLRPSYSSFGIVPPTGAFWYLPGSCRVLNLNPAKLKPYPLEGARASDCLKGRHNDGINVGFCDGHAKWLRADVMIAEVLKGKPTPRGAWNPDNP
jgi:prepilin-type processing-associated H-X9-DG protein